MTYQSINPTTGKTIKSFEHLSSAQLEKALAAAESCFRTWKHTSYTERAAIVAKAAALMHAHVDDYATLATLEMGKRIDEARGEVKFSADILAYYAKNAEAFLSGGWYRMGDVVRKRGRYVYTEGRRNDMINRGGEKISCEEVENLILTHPKIKSAVLVGMPDPIFGEKACACVVTLQGESLHFSELIAFLRERQIASFKLPERLELFSELPISPVGKILKRQLRETIAERLAQERAAHTKT